MRLRMCEALAAVSIALSGPAFAEEGDAPPATIPTLAASALTVEGFAPAGWIVEAKVSGDLDRDGRDDMAFVLRGTDPALKVMTPVDRELDTNPRLLGVAVGEAGGGYRLVVENATLIPRHVEWNLADPFEKSGLSITKGAAVVSLTNFATMGGWDSANVTFTLRLIDGRLRAIGFDRTDIKRNTGAMTTTSVNYLTGRKSVAKGSIQDDAEKKTWSRVPTPGPAIDQIGDGLMFGAAR